nr:transposase [Nostoc sp. ChiQUE02]MDZ8229589.1 transposase [Nostoc sp. ChiQUE02]
MDWFFGFKLHIIVNELGQLLNVTLTPGNIDDRKPVPDLLCGLFGKIFGVSVPLRGSKLRAASRREAYVRVAFRRKGIAAMFPKNLLLNFWKSSESNFLPNPVAT